MGHIELSGQFIAIVKSVISDIDECATGKDKCGTNSKCAEGIVSLHL